MNQIQEGTTTRAEVEKTFGPPRRVARGANQKTLTLHSYHIDRHNPGWVGVAEGIAGSIVLRNLTVLYDTNQVAEKFLFDQSSTTVRRYKGGLYFGWSPANVDFSKIIKGITSRGELLLWYGVPTMQTMNTDGDRMLCWGYMGIGRFGIENREQEFRVVLDQDDFVKDFGLFGNTDARMD